jgi:hypothetical protein
LISSVYGWKVAHFGVKQQSFTPPIMNQLVYDHDNPASNVGFYKS